MARYNHLPIYKRAQELMVYVETVVRGFSRYHKYTIGTRLRESTWLLRCTVGVKVVVA